MNNLFNLLNEHLGALPKLNNKVSIALTFEIQLGELTDNIKKFKINKVSHTE